MKCYDSKLRSEQDRALNQKASHEVNQGLRDYELSKNSTIQLQKVKLLSSEQFREETFNEMVNREINGEEGQDNNQVEQLEVIKSMRQIKGDGVKKKDEYIDMGTIEKMRDYQQLKKEMFMEN